MSEIVQRVAREIAKIQHSEGAWPAYVTEARAAIAAMLSPTSKMIDEGGAQVYLAGEDAKPSEIAAGVWRDMIAEALREDPA